MYAHNWYHVYNTNCMHVIFLAIAVPSRQPHLNFVQEEIVVTLLCVSVCPFVHSNISWTVKALKEPWILQRTTVKLSLSNQCQVGKSRQAKFYTILTGWSFQTNVRSNGRYTCYILNKSIHKKYYKNVQSMKIKMSKMTARSIILVRMDRGRTYAARTLYVCSESSQACTTWLLVASIAL